MRSLPSKYFGPSGLPCLFTVDDVTGETSVGHLVKQISQYRYIVSDGTTTRLAYLAQKPEDIANPNAFPPETFTIFLTLADGSVEQIKQISEFKCGTVQGTTIAWHTADPNESTGSITMPVLNDILLEDGSYWLLEDGSYWLLESA